MVRHEHSLSIQFVMYLLLLATLLLLLHLFAVSDAAYGDSGPVVTRMQGCIRKSGAIVMRVQCRQSETRMTLSALAAQLPAPIIGRDGAQGPQGERGASAFDVIPSGTTIYGIVGGVESAKVANDHFVQTQTIMGVLPQPLTEQKVAVANTPPVTAGCGGANCLMSSELLDSPVCTGTFGAPTAPPGVLCIYIVAASNVLKDSVSAGSAPPNTDPATTMRIPGFYISWTASAGGSSTLAGTWAYTAP